MVICSKLKLAHSLSQLLQRQQQRVWRAQHICRRFQQMLINLVRFCLYFLGECHKNASLPVEKQYHRASEVETRTLAHAVAFYLDSQGDLKFNKCLQNIARIFNKYFRWTICVQLFKQRWDWFTRSQVTRCKSLFLVGESHKWKNRQSWFIQAFLQFCCSAIVWKYDLVNLVCSISEETDGALEISVKCNFETDRKFIGLLHLIDHGVIKEKIH